MGGRHAAMRYMPGSITPIMLLITPIPLIIHSHLVDGIPKARKKEMRPTNAAAGCLLRSGIDVESANRNAEAHT